RSAAALTVAAENARRHGVADRINWIESDLLDGLPADARFDLIVSNPPYVSEAEWAGLAPDVRDHEPREALVAGPRGTEVIERLIPQAVARLRSGGHLLLEISPMIAEAVHELIAAEPSLGDPAVIKDLARLPRVVRCEKR
ncbi:MAG: methyltransferase, partial [Pirellulales bacterium]|nr:methyltransferase [Pirellulales bacterium]